MISGESIASILHAEVSRKGGQKAAAKRLGVSGSYLCDVLKGRRAMGARLLAALGYRRVVMYERINQR